MQQFDLQQIGPYRIIHLIGRGGMGAVYLAEDPRIKRQVAIKVMQIEISSPNDTSADKRADKKAARLQREATAIARLDHPGIVRLLSYDELNTQGGRYPYLVMEYYGEGSFAEWLRQHPDLPLHDAAYFIGQAANALQYAHENGVIHQDIKPANFLIRTRKDHPNLPNLLLTDFGVARLTDASSSTVPTAPMGTYTYMAPEQFDSNARPLPATDQYSLAVMTYQLITGRPPFQGPQPAVMKQHLWDQPQPPGIFNPHLPREVDNVILRALAKRPEDRYSSITEFARAFQQALQSQRGNDIREIIRINAAEAQTGTSHILTLPGGRQVTVSVPPGAQNGQIISLAGLGEPSRSGGPAGNLLVTIDNTFPAGPTAPPPLQPQPPPPVQVVAPPASSAPTRQAAPDKVVEPSAPMASVPESTPVSAASVPGTEIQVGIPLRWPDESTPVSAASVPGTASAPSGPASLSATQAVSSPPTSADISSVSSSAQPVVPSKRGISRRTVVVGLAGLTVVGVAGCSLILLGSSQQPAAPTPTPTPAVPKYVVNTPYIYRGHSDGVLSVAWSPDGRRIASGGLDSTVQVWDAANGGHTFTYQGHSNHVRSIAWSPDGSRIASGSEDNTVHVWDAANGGHVFTYRGHSDAIWSVAWSPDGKRIASGSQDNTVQVWDASSGATLLTYKGHTSGGGVLSVAWSPDGKRIASGDIAKIIPGPGATVRIWDASSGATLLTFKPDTNVVESVAWSPDGKRIASGGGLMTVPVWNAANGGLVFTYHVQLNDVGSLAWSPDGKRIASGDHLTGGTNTVVVWDAANGGHVFTYRGHSDAIWSVAWSPDGTRIASGSDDKTVQVWQAE